MKLAPINLEKLEGREKALTGIKRYIHFITPIMFYRTNNLIHSRRVLWHLEEALPNILKIYGDIFEVDFARTLALVHDDVEIITGDVQLYDKERMNDNEKERLAQKEIKTIPLLIQIYGTRVNGFDYQELLTAAKEKNSLEAQLVSYFDKMDGGGEAWHEVWAGNVRFLRPAGGDANGGYVRRLNEFPSKYPLVAQFLEHCPEYLPHLFDFASIAERSQPHTPDSLRKDSGYPLYEKWKRTIMKREGINLLTEQVEFDK